MSKYYYRGSLRYLLLILGLIILINSSIIYDESIHAEEQIDSISGNWKGKMIGETSIEEAVVKILYEIKLSSDMEGTFEGDVSQGEWIGEYVLTYDISVAGIHDQGKGILKGEYVLITDDSGIISGEGTADLSGVMIGQIEFKIEGSKTDTGQLIGKWNGVATSEEVAIGGTAIPLQVTLEANGDFEGILEPKETIAATTTTPITPSTPATTIETPTQTPEIQKENQNLTYVIIGAIVIIIVLGIYALNKRRKA